MAMAVTALILGLKHEPEMSFQERVYPNQLERHMTNR